MNEQFDERIFDFVNGWWERYGDRLIDPLFYLFNPGFDPFAVPVPVPPRPPAVNHFPFIRQYRIRRRDPDETESDSDSEDNIQPYSAPRDEYSYDRQRQRERLELEANPDPNPEPDSESNNFAEFMENVAIYFGIESTGDYSGLVFGAIKYTLLFYYS